MNDKLRFFVQKPTATRKTYVVSCYTLLDRKKQYHKLDPSLKTQIDSINKQFTTGVVKASEAELLLEDLIQKQYRKLNVKHMVLKNAKLSAINKKIFNQFWDKVYGARILSDEESPKYDILKALKLVDPLSLATATDRELQSALKKNCRKVNEHRRAVDRLNQILTFLKRDCRLNKPSKGIKVIQYVTKDEFDQLLPLIPDQDLKDLATTLFCSGVRLSEALALTVADYIGGKLNVTKQLTKTGQIKPPKRGKVGKVVVVSFGVAAIKRWIALPQSSKDHCRTRLFGALADACRLAFPTESTKWIGPHDLRHSHAIYLLGKGASLTQVSLNLRNRLDVCQEYYTGYCHTDETLDALKGII